MLCQIEAYCDPGNVCLSKNQAVACSPGKAARSLQPERGTCP